jgi:hypothetical protein
MTMFPMPMPELPQEVIDMVGANPEGFAEAMGSGMEAMTAAMEGGASPADAFEAMGDVMGPLMEDMGMSPDMFDAMGDMMGAGIGGGMHMAPADATGGDMGAIMQDGIDMMMPEGVDCPPAIMDAMGDMGSAMGDAGMSCHDCAAEMMPPPGDPGYPMPMDGAGNPVVEPGDPATCPSEACQPPPMDGACATTAPDMMPPMDGYDHAPMDPGMTMPEPFVMATPDPTGELSGAENIAPAGDDGGAAALDGAMGGEEHLGEIADPAMDAIDLGMANAMDAATDQGGGGNGMGDGDADGSGDGGTGMGDGDGGGSDDVDPSAGMG